MLLISLNENAPVVAKVADFGTSMQLFIDAFKEEAQTRTVSLPNWLAPEVLSEDSYSEKCDVYGNVCLGFFFSDSRNNFFFFFQAYGIILWELVSRKHPVKHFAFRKADFFFTFPQTLIS